MKNHTQLFDHCLTLTTVTDAAPPIRYYPNLRICLDRKRKPGTGFDGSERERGITASSGGVTLICLMVKLIN